MEVPADSGVVRSCASRCVLTWRRGRRSSLEPFRGTNPVPGAPPPGLHHLQRSRLLTPSHCGGGHHSSRLITMNLGNTNIESIAEVQVGGTGEKSEPTAGLRDGCVERCADSWLGTRGEDPAVGGAQTAPQRQQCWSWVWEHLLDRGGKGEPTRLREQHSQGRHVGTTRGCWFPAQNGLGRNILKAGRGSDSIPQHWGATKGFGAKE